MARQGNYVPGVGGNVNWASGISDSLTGLSKSLLGQASEERERERLAAAEEENKRRFDLKNQRDQELFGRGTTDYNRQLAERDAIKNTRFDDATLKSIQTKKARDIYNVTDEQFEKHRDQLLSLIPVTQEDVADHYASIHRARFGTPLDQSLVSGLYSHLDSDVALQAREDANAQALAQQNKYAADYDLKLAQALAPTSSMSSSFKSKGGGKVPTSYSDIDPVDLAKTFKGANFWDASWFTKSEKEDVVKLVNNLKSDLGTAGATAAEAKAGILHALSNLTEGDDLNELNNNPAKADELAKEGIKLYRENPDSGYTRYSKEFSKYQQTLKDQIGKYKPVTPTDIKKQRRERVRRELDELFGRTSGARSATTRAPARTPSRTSVDTTDSPRGSSRQRLDTSEAAAVSALANNEALRNTLQQGASRDLDVPLNEARQTVSTQPFPSSPTEEAQLFGPSILGGSLGRAVQTMEQNRLDSLVNPRTGSASPSAPFFSRPSLRQDTAATIDALNTVRDAAQRDINIRDNAIPMSPRDRARLSMLASADADRSAFIPNPQTDRIVRDLSVQMRNSPNAFVQSVLNNRSLLRIPAVAAMYRQLQDSMNR